MIANADVVDPAAIEQRYIAHRMGGMLLAYSSHSASILTRCLFGESRCMTGLRHLTTCRSAARGRRTVRPKMGATLADDETVGQASSPRVRCIGGLDARHQALCHSFVGACGAWHTASILCP